MKNLKMIYDLNVSFKRLIQVFLGICTLFYAFTVDVDARSETEEIC